MALDSGAEPLDRVRGPDDPCPVDPRKRARDCYFCWHGEPHPAAARPVSARETLRGELLPPLRVVDLKAAAPDSTGLCVVCRQVTTCNCAKCLAAKGGRVNTCGKCARAAAAAGGEIMADQRHTTLLEAILAVDRESNEWVGAA